MTDDKRAKMLERVRALLAKAASTNFPAEADSFRAKADQLMTEYAIEQWMVDQAQNAVGARPVPERRDMDFGWWRTNPFRHQLWDMFSAVARHCRCVVATEKANYSEQRIPVFGLQSDLDWFDLLFTQLMIAMIQKVDPQPRPELTLMENIALMREAGMPWEPALNRIIRAGECEDVTINPGTTFEEVYKPWVHAYRRWCRETGHPQSYVNQRTFRQNFADGFAEEIRTRLYAMRRETEKAYDASHQAGSMALVVRDIMDIVREMMWEVFPDLKPHPAGCDCEDCHYCRDPNCQRRNCKARRQPVRARQSAASAQKIDWAARNAGREAGSQVDLANKASERIGNRRALEG